MKKRLALLAGLAAAALLAFHFLVPQQAVGKNAALYGVERNGIDITEKLSQEQLNGLEALAADAQCARWRNPMGAYPLRQDTVVLELWGESAGRKYPCRLYLVGGMDCYRASWRSGEDYSLRKGEDLLTQALEIIGQTR